MSVKTLIIRTAGTNCDQETIFAFERAGAETSLLHINRVNENPAVKQTNSKGGRPWRASERGKSPMICGRWWNR